MVEGKSEQKGKFKKLFKTVLNLLSSFDPFFIKVGYFPLAYVLEVDDIFSNLPADGQFC